MSRSLAVSLVVTVSLLVGGLVLAQPEPVPAPVSEPVPEAAVAPQYSVSVGGDVAVLLEINSGRTWTHYESIDGVSRWLEAKRIDGLKVDEYLRAECELAKTLGMEFKRNHIDRHK